MWADVVEQLEANACTYEYKLMGQPPPFVEPRRTARQAVEKEASPLPISNAFEALSTDDTTGPSDDPTDSEEGGICSSAPAPLPLMRQISQIGLRPPASSS